MLKIMKHMPDNVLGISAEGKITGSDYETVLIPAVEQKMKTHKKIRMLYHLGSEFTGFDMAAMLDDTKIGMKYFSAWDRVALVSGHEWINTFARFFGHMFPCEFQTFKNEELDEAKKWIAEK